MQVLNDNRIYRHIFLINLPEKSIPLSSTSAPRREIVKHELIPKPHYTSLDDLIKKAERLKLTGWSKTVNETNVTLVFWNKTFALPKLSVTIEVTLNFTVGVYNWLLPDDHTFYLTHKRSVRNTTLSSILSLLQQFQVCDGLPFEEPFVSVAVDPSSDHCFGNIIRHTVPISQNHYDVDGPPFQARVFLRSHDCYVLCDGGVTTQKSLSKSQRKQKSPKKLNRFHPMHHFQPLVKKGWLQLCRSNVLFVNKWKKRSLHLKQKLKRTVLW